MASRWKTAEAKAISPEITRTKMGSATALAESPLSPDVLWAGTDDGFLWLTRDGGATPWTNAAGLPGRYVTSIATSPITAGVAWAAASGFNANTEAV